MKPHPKTSLLRNPPPVPQRIPVPAAEIELFGELTGMHLHVQHLPADAEHPAGWCPSAQRRKIPRPGCHSCQSRMETHATRTNSTTWFSSGLRASGNCGLTSFWIDFPASAISTVRLMIQARLESAETITGTLPGLEDPAPSVTETHFEHATHLLGLLHQSMTLAAENEEIRSRLNQRETTPPLGTPVLPDRGDHDGMEASPVRSHARHVAEAMMDYAQNHFHHPMGLCDVAASIGMNASYLSHLFKTVTGTPFHKHLEDIRLSKARELLLDPARHVCEVAAEVGYSCPDQFRHAFKARFGHPPSDFR